MSSACGALVSEQPGCEHIHSAWGGHQHAGGEASVFSILRDSLNVFFSVSKFRYFAYYFLFQAVKVDCPWLLRSLCIW